MSINVQPKPINWDNIFIEIGEFGKFQVINFICVLSAFVFVICSSFSYIFVTNDLEYRCKVPDCDDFEQSPIWITNAIPIDGNKCEMYSRMDDIQNINVYNCSRETFNRSSIVQCSKFIFKTEEINILNEFNLTCNENRWKLSFMGSLGNIAECITLPFIGLLADRYGRQPILMYSVLMVGIFGLAKSFATNYLSYAILHFIGCLFGAGTFAIAFVLGAEIVGPTWRSTGAAIITNGFAFGQILLAVIAMNVSHFRHLLRILYILVLLVLSYLWLVPESVRWLYTAGKYDKAKKIIRMAAKVNNSQISDRTLASLDEYESETKALLEGRSKVRGNRKGPMLAIIKSKTLLFRLINCCYCFFTNALIFYGLSVRSTDLAGDKYWNLLLAASMEIPGNVSSHFVLKKMSRKWALTVSMIVCGTFCVSSELLGDYSPTWRLVLFLLGKCSVSFSFTVLSVYITELFPTNCRMRMFNVCKTCGGIANIVAPQIPLLASLMPSLPMCMFGVTSITSALLVFFLPDTSHSQMPQTVADAKNIGKSLS